ncbi:MAG: DEAD/DEAH box helicase [Lactobacillales bacterium]|jgi:superfamily II DNA or RNA helicase|nr:DEAD/DEAH box helicase [Lactobacillales bacterium]
MSEHLELALRKGFINYNQDAFDVYEPKLITNDQENRIFTLNALQEQLDTCKSFFISVAFVTQSGLNGLKSHFSDLASNGVRGRLLTSNYLAFNSPEVFRDLLKIPNLDVRITEAAGFHVKGYLFEQADYETMIIGSSNLTMNALKTNVEWNVKLTSFENGDLLRSTKNALETMWDAAKPLNEDWINIYKISWKPKFSNVIYEPESVYSTIRPNSMQLKALAGLQQLRKEGKSKALLISATGTGKTYLSAFEVRQVNPERMLFIVHREQILKAAMTTFQNVIGGYDSDFGLYTGTSKDLNAKYLFATIQSISKDDALSEFARNHFDYIIIDEVHKAGAASYLKVLDYFEPSFLMGMTATPERTDDFNIFELFDYNIAYEIRLQEAMEADLLSPFHYFGVSDFVRDGLTVDETSKLQYLVADERVDYLLKKIKYYGVSGSKVRGLVFCPSIEVAMEMSSAFNDRGFRSVALTGAASIAQREEDVARLETGPLDYIFTVDIFNEGIDIPSVNQVILMRNTESSIIFIQQLGRGLRKHSSKEFVTIIDFIGAYKNNYMIPVALTGDNSGNKDNLRHGTFDTNYISGVSSINFEAVAKERVFEAINNAKLDDAKRLREAYHALKNRLNRKPMLIDFLEQGSVDPYLIANKYDSYYSFLVKINEAESVLNISAQKLLKFASRELLPGLRRDELDLLVDLLAGKSVSAASLAHTNVLSVLDCSWFSGSDKKTYEGCALIKVDNEIINLSDDFRRALDNDYFALLFSDLLATGLEKAKKYSAARLTRYAKYTRKDAIKLLGWNEQMVAQNIGGYACNENDFAIFITLHKGDDFAGAQMTYEDELISQNTLKWFTKSPRTINSPEVVKLLNYYSDYGIHVFMQKNDDEGGIQFYYLGEVYPDKNSILEVEKPVKDGTLKPVVEMNLHFKEPIDYKLFKYLTD